MKTVPPAQLRQACNRREAERGPLPSTACVPRCLTSAPRTSLSTGDRFKQPGRPRPGREGKEWDVPGSELSPHDRALPQSKETRGEETPEGKIVATPCQQIRMLNMAATCRGVRSPSCDGATAALD